jgi:nucleoside-diphosphate-sugar epimerase
MRIFVAGASGAVGRRLIPQLAGRGHEVTGTTRTPDKTAAIRALGAEPVVVNALAALRHLEAAVTSADPIEGIVLRYGAFYGPGTDLGTDLGTGGQMLDMIRKRRLPVVGGGTGVFSFVHIDDAAHATVLAIEDGPPGIYNIVDDEPAPVREWLPYLAQVLGAKPPLRLPAWLVRPMLGEHGVSLMTAIRGSSNAKARRDLSWVPRYPSWRLGFREGLG